MINSWMGSRARSHIALGIGAITAWIVVSACGMSDDAAEEAGDAGDGGAAGSSSGGTGATSGTGGAAGSDVDSGGSGGGSLGSFTALPTAYAVHASPDLFAFRLCAEVNDEIVTEYPYPFDSDHHLAESNYPGIAVGGYVDLAALLNEIGSSSIVTLHAVRAAHPVVARATPDTDKLTCASLLSGFNQLPDQDFVTFENVDLGNTSANAIRVLIVDGCQASDPPELGTAQCGETYDPTVGNLAAHVMEFSPMLTMEPSTTMVYPAHLSPSLAALQPEHTLELSYGNLTSATGRISISSNVPQGAPTMTAGALTTPSTIAEYGQTGFTLVAKKSAGDEQPLMAASLAHIQRVSSPYDTPEAFFTSSNGLLLILIGDVSAQSQAWLEPNGSWNPAYDGRGLHALALPFSFQYSP